MIERTVAVPADPEEVWLALTDPDRVQAWIGGRLDWAVEEGSGLHFEGADGRSRDGRVEQVDRPRILRFRWWDTGDRERPEASEVEYLLEPAGDSTLLTVREAAVREAAVRDALAPRPEPVPCQSAAPRASGAPMIVARAGAWSRFDQFQLEMVWAASRSAVSCGVG